MHAAKQVIWISLVTIALTACSDDSGSRSAATPGNDTDPVMPTAACDDPPERMVTAEGVEFVRTPDACFDGLVDFPYEGQYVEIDGLRQAYVDEGPEGGEVVLLLHGQPSWSYLYRKMIPLLADAGYRVVAMDHLGTGRSDKPTDIDDYTYLGHSDRLERFITTLGLSDINLFVQDWGSLIGLKVAGENPDWFASIAVGDGSLPSIPEGVELYPGVENPNEIVDIPSLFENIPEQQEPFYDGCDLMVTLPDENYFGSWMEYAMKAESFHASEVLEAMTWFPLSEAEEAAYDAPFPSRIYMAGIRKFPSIVNELGGQTAAAVAGLAGFEKPFITIWASNDAGNLGSCETQRYLIDLVPGAKGQAHTRLPEASHFLQDDQGEEIARRLLDFYDDPAPFVPESPEGIAEEDIGFEILQILSADEIVVWVSRDITREEFDALELPNGWRKNEPRETDASAGSFARSPSASEDGPLVEEELFGYVWQQNATIVETGIAMDDDGLLNASSVAKFHTITYDALSTIYVLVSPTGEEYVRVTRDADRVSEVFTLPEGWRLIEQLLSEPLTLTLPNPTLNIRADNQDSFQGPVSVLRAGSLDTGQDSSHSGPLALGPDLCEDPANMDVLLESPMFTEMASNGGFNGEQLQRMVDEPTAGPFYMFNLIRYRDEAVYADGRATDLTGREANELYNPIEFLSAIGARPVFSTGVDQQIDGDEPLWDDVGIVEYPCPVAFFAMVTDPGFQERAVNKDAGVETTWIMVTHLEPSPLPDGYTAPESPFPPSEEDPAFELIHVKDYHDIAQYEDDADEPERTGAEAWDLYSQGGSAAATEIGSLPTARFTVQGVLAGDDRSWDAIDINYMPSREAFQALLDDQTRQEGRYHRYAALADNYSLITYPNLNVIPGAPGSVGGDGTGDIGSLPVTDLGVGKVCMSDADCSGIGTCVSEGSGAGFCTRQCGSGECGSPYVCCYACSASVAAQLPFNDSACLPEQGTDQLTAAPASCTCD